jgi:hypothetical protein
MGKVRAECPPDLTLRLKTQLFVGGAKSDQWWTQENVTLIEFVNIF